MRFDAMRLRAAFMLMGVVAVAIWFMVTGGRMPPKPVVQIEFGSYPDFQGMTVQIDGKPAGKLQTFGSATRSGFEVKEGRHVIKVVDRRYKSIARNVDVKANRTPVLLILDFQQTVDRNGRMATAIGWQN